MNISLNYDDGSSVDITELVRITYDVAVGSMDYSSGFLDQEELYGLANLATACGFPNARENVEELWKKRLLDGKTHVELQQMAKDRGVRYWSEIQPSDAELEAFLEELKAGR